MKFIIDFYQNLDTINLIIFWGVIIVIVLLLVFSIILVNKNKKLKEIIRSNRIEIDDDKDILAIKTQELSEEKEIPVNKVILSNQQINDLPQETPNTKDNISPIIVQQQIIEQNNEINKEQPVIKKPYEKNILKEMTPNSQTSPIGIVRKENIQEKEMNKAKELQNILNEPLHETKVNSFNATKEDNFSRTEYELKQEEDAIISFKELMEKKDKLNIVDEEDAVISIEELIKKKEKEKLYQLTENEENDKFIDELKHFRSDL